MTNDGDHLQTPLDAAVKEQKRDTLRMVQRAIDTRNVVLAYQPIMQAKHSTRVAFWEGLLRVLADTGRVVPAKDFIMVAETHEMGRQLDCLALDKGLQVLATYPDLRLSINMSARSIGYPRWTETLESGLAVDPTVGERLILEITESSAMLMPDIVAAFMDRLQSKNISFALDDFGAGYTAFRYFRDFFFDIIKIDGQFTSGIARDADNQCLTKALIGIAAHFDMFTVAERVETEEDAHYLTSIGIDCLQGYLYGAPTLHPEWLGLAEQRSA